MQLSKNFWLHEFLKSQRAARAGRKVEASAEIIVNLTRLCKDILQPVRDALSAELKREVVTVVTSGYRPKWLNKLTKGSATSYHLDGLAADIEMNGISNYDLCKWIEKHISAFPIDKVIYEYGDWVHIQAAKDGAVPRRQVLTATYDPGHKKTVYIPGVVKQEEN